jgi:hypothetical protein
LYETLFSICASLTLQLNKGKDRQGRLISAALVISIEILKQYEVSHPLSDDESDSEPEEREVPVTSSTTELDQMRDSRSKEKSAISAVPGWVRFFVAGHHVLGSIRCCCSNEGQFLFELISALKDLDGVCD